MHMQSQKDHEKEKQENTSKEHASKPIAGCPYIILVHCMHKVET